MGCSCIKHNLIDEETKEFNPSEDDNKDNKEQEKINNNININNYNIKIINNKSNNIIENDNINNNKNNENNESEIFKSSVIINNQSIPNVNNNNNKLKTKNLSTNEEQDNIMSTNIINKESDFLTNNVYNKRIFELINKVRVNPAEYSKYVLDNIKNIITENKEELNKNTAMKEIKQITVFKKKVKVRLYKGEEGFFETAKYLQKLSPMEPLKFNENIVLPINDIGKKDLIKDKINNYNINAFFKGNIKNPEIAVLLMIVDDNESLEKKKRNTLLNKEYKYIGIDSKFSGKNFIAHFSFSK